MTFLPSPVRETWEIGWEERVDEGIKEGGSHEGRIHACCLLPWLFSLVLSLSGTWVWDESLSLIQGCKVMWDGNVCKNSAFWMDWAAVIEGVFTQTSPAGLVTLGSSYVLNASIMTPQLSLGIYWIQGNLQCNNTHFSFLAIWAPICLPTDVIHPPSL